MALLLEKKLKLGILGTQEFQKWIQTGMRGASGGLEVTLLGIVCQASLYSFRMTCLEFCWI